MRFSSTKIKNLRLERGWSQEHLAAVTGLSSRTVQRIETEGSASPESLMAIAGAFSISPSDLKSNHNEKIGDGSIKFSGLIGLILILAILFFYLYITGNQSAIIDIPALLYVVVVPFAISFLSSGFKATLHVYQLISWLIYEQKGKVDAHLFLPVLRKLIIYSYASGVTGSLLSLLGMLAAKSEIFLPAGFSITLLILIYATIQSEFIFRPLYHKLNRQLIEPINYVS